MTIDTNGLLQWVVYFALLLARMSAFFILSPIFGRTNIPTQVRVLLALSMSVLLLTAYPAPADLNFISIWDFLLVLVMEMIVGFVMGYINATFFSAVLTAGSYIDMQIGFSMVTVLDPSTSQQVPIVGSLLNIVLLESFLLANGHLVLIRYMYQTYQVLPVANVTLNADLFTVILEGFVTAFLLGLNIALPIIVGILLAEVALGLLVRVSPQMNVFVVGVGLKTIVGLLLLIAIVPIFIGMTQSIFENMYSMIDRAFQSMMTPP